MFGLGLSRRTENREIDCSMLKYFLLLQTMFPAICDMGVKESVAHCANTLSEVRVKAE